MQFLHQVLYIIVWVVPLFTSENPEFCPMCNSPDDCLSSLTQKDCPDGTYLVRGESLCKCCPKCKTGLEFGEMCNPISKCAPGLSCINNVCIFDKSGCSYTYHLSNLKNLPTCEVDGSFAAVQCKGDRTTGRCFCHAETGERIYGFSWYRDSQNMTCKCSRMKHKMSKGDRYDNTLHCDTKGNFEPLQCDDGICWCANVKTGQIIKVTRAVPEAMWDRLPCYDIKKMGPQYLRPCESGAYAQQIMKKHLAIHGTTNIEYNNIQCDFDGSYGIYKLINGNAYCTWRDGETIPPFQAGPRDIGKMNCLCARDQKIFQKAGMDHILSCNGNGNYNADQWINGKAFCVDRDGFAVTQLFDNADALNCPQCTYYEVQNPNVNGKC